MSVAFEAHPNGAITILTSNGSSQQSWTRPDGKDIPNRKCKRAITTQWPAVPALRVSLFVIGRRNGWAKLGWFRFLAPCT